jgi:hypothetical protein
MRKPSGTQWDRIDSMKDEEIDFSDCPELDEEFFEKAVRWNGPKMEVELQPSAHRTGKGTMKKKESADDQR